jgi:pimeloyl-ACP methyl ester carboxylesterase
MACGDVLRYLRRHGSDRVCGIVLVATITPVVQPPEVVAAFQAALRADRPAFLTAGAPGFFGSDVSPEKLAWGVGLAAQASLRASAELFGCLGVDLTDDLLAVDVPAVVVHGDADQSSPIDATGRPTAELIPEARLVVVEGAPHGLPLTHPDQLAEVLQAPAIMASATMP